MDLIIRIECPRDIGELTSRAFKNFSLPRGVVRELEWCVYQDPGFERAHWEEILHSNCVPEDLGLHILRRMDEVEQYISSHRWYVSENFAFATN